MYGIKAAIYWAQGAEHGEYLLGTLAQKTSGAIDGEQIAGIELTDKLHEDLYVVDVEHHAIEVVFEETALEVGQAAQRVGVHLGTGVLRHHQSVLVIKVGYYESILGQCIEESLLGTQVIVYRLVVVHVVAREVGEDTSGKLEPTDAALCHRVRTHLHEHILAALIGHAPQ